MGTTAQKLQRVLDTKEGLKDTINTYLGQDITSAIPFKDYETYIKNFYNSLPKTDYEEGSNITLSNTLKGKLDFEDGIVGIGQTEQESTTGANLLPLPFATRTLNGITITNNGDGTYTLNGTSTDISYFGGEDISSLNISCSRLICLPSNWASGSGYATAQYTDNSYSGNDVGNGAAVDNTKTIKRFALLIQSGKTFNNVVIKPMLTNDTTRTYATWEPYTNGASPNPSYPQEIEVVRGKNLLSSDIEQNGIDNATGQNVTSNDQYRTADYINIAPNTQYTLSINGTAQQYVVYFYDSNKNFIRYVGASTGSFTTPSNATFIRFRNYVSDYRSDFASLKIQLEKGSQATSYLPFNTIEARIRNANLVKSKYVNPTVSSYLIVLQADFDIKPSTTYTISFNGREGNKVYFNEYLFDGPATQTYLTIESGRTIKTITTKDTISDSQKNSNGWYIFKNQAGNTEANIFDDLQIEEGSTSTTYEPYQTPQTYQLSLGEYEFAKGNDNADEIIYDIENDKVYKNEKINKKVLNGTEGWIDNINWDNQYPEILHSYTVINDWLKGQTQYFCDKFICTTDANRDFTKEMMTCHRTSNVPYIFVFISRLNGVTINSTVEEKINALKVWLSENEPEVWYQLNTPVLKEITGTLKDQIKALYYSHSFNGTTIIEINGQLPLIIKVRALKGE